MPASRCALCDTFWRLYSAGTDNLRELVSKHADAVERNDHESAEMLTHEIAIAESSLYAVRLELRRHEHLRHLASQSARKPAEDRPDLRLPQKYRDIVKRNS